MIVRAIVAVWCALALAGGSANAQDTPRALGEASLEDLMDLRVVAAGRKDQRVDDVAAAVYVVSRDDIRRSGAQTLADALRLVPGVQVARLNATRWAVSVRGFNSLHANKVLVLIDGRSIYNGLSTGVYWGAEDLPLDEIERIEVIRGSGGAVWGANAVNGVINVVTRVADAAHGGDAVVSGGSLGAGRAEVRYAGSIRSVAYRAYSQWRELGATKSSGEDAADAMRTFGQGLRLDWSDGRDAVSFDAGWNRNEARSLWMHRLTPLDPVVTGGQGRSDAAHATGRWTRRLGDGRRLQVQSFANLWRRSDPNVSLDAMTVYDIDAEYHVGLGDRHDLVLGGGYRWIQQRVDGTFMFSLTPDRERRNIANVFAQDEIAIAKRLRLTVGSKIERESEARVSLQPSARLMWHATPGHDVWAATSRAIRTPSMSERLMRVHLGATVVPNRPPTYLALLGNPELAPETVVSTEAGYRFTRGRVLAIDAAAFLGRYGNLLTTEPGGPVLESTPETRLLIPMRFANLLDARTTGLEVSGRGAPLPWLRFDAWYATFHIEPTLDPQSRDAAKATFDASTPQHQWQLRGAVSRHGRELSATIHHVGSIRGLEVPAYTRVSARFGMPLSERLTLAAIGDNLQAPAHAEWAGAVGGIRSTDIPRSLRVELGWNFLGDR